MNQEKDARGKKIRNTIFQYGFVPTNCNRFHPKMDVERLIIQRRKLKKQDNFKEADKIREKLTGWYYEIMDRENGVDWIQWT